MRTEEDPLGCIDGQPIWCDEAYSVFRRALRLCEGGVELVLVFLGLQNGLSVCGCSGVGCSGRDGLVAQEGVCGGGQGGQQSVSVQELLLVTLQ